MVEKAEFTEKKYQDVQRFLLEFPSRNNNLINNEQIKHSISDEWHGHQPNLEIVLAPGQHKFIISCQLELERKCKSQYY